MKRSALRTKKPTTQVQIVFPPDTRVPVNPTTGPFFRMVGQLTMTFPNGITYVGTGTLLNQSTVLTCAHNLFDNSIGGWATQVQFTPARNGQLAPFGIFAAAQNGLSVPDLYRQLSPPNPNQSNGAVPGGLVEVTQYIYDYGVVRLAQAVNMADFFGMYAADDNQIRASNMDITGYPGDKPPGTMWHAQGPVIGFSDELLFYTISTFEGQSGSPLRMPIAGLNPPGWPWIIGVHVAGSTGLGANFAVRLTDDVIEEVMGWMA
jgi:V8-like Glu-specific endopeptidase